MATSFTFNGVKIELPGIYSRITSGFKNPPLSLDYGKVLIVDTGSGAGWGFGAGISGTLKNGADAVYSNIKDMGTMKALMKGGLWWKLAEPLFKPDGNTSTGVSEIEFVRAATTAPATISYSFPFGLSNSQTLVTVTTVAPGVGVAQENTITVGSAIDVGDKFRVTQGATTVEYIAVFGDDNSDVASALQALIAASSGFTNVTATVLANVITLVANATNTPFTQTSTTVNTTGTAGSLTIQVRDEGLIGNGVAINSGTLLVKGYGAEFVAGDDDTSKYMIKFYLGTYKGDDSMNGNIPFDNIADSDTVPMLVAQTPETNQLSEIIAWMESDYNFNQLFKLSASTAGNDYFVASDITAAGGLELAAGGTETYSNAAFDKVLDTVVADNYSFILSDKWNDDVLHLYNTKFATHINGEAKYDKFLMIGGGNEEGDFQTNTLDACATYNMDRIQIVHGSSKMTNTQNVDGFNTYESIFKAAMVTGRLAGLPPQVPLTFKSLGISGDVHILNEKEQKRALKAGAIVTYWDTDFQKWTVLQGVNTLQRNDNFINDDGTSYSIQIMRIAAQLNKELVINGKKQLFGNPNGVNQNTLSTQTIRDWLVGYLKKRVAKPTKDDLIIDYDASSITVERQQDMYHVSYKFQPNGEITKMFLTGFMIN